MKLFKHLALAAAIISTFAMTSCDSKADKVKKANQELYQLAKASTSEDPTVTFESRTLTYRYKVEPSVFSRINADNLKAKTLEELKSVTNQSLVKTITEANAKVQYVYVCDSDSISFDFVPADFAPAEK